MMDQMLMVAFELVGILYVLFVTGIFIAMGLFGGKFSVSVKINNWRERVNEETEEDI